jgi:preprotein translocase subunit SecA
MLDGIKEEAVGFLFNLKVQVEEAPAPVVDPSQAMPLPDLQPHVEIKAKGLGHRTPQALQYSAPTIDGEAGSGGVVREQAPALGIGGDTPNGAAGRSPEAGARRSGPASPTAAGARKPSPGQSVSAGGPSRNAPCPCGSGKKYKRCHGAPGGPA